MDAHSGEQHFASFGHLDGFLARLDIYADDDNILDSGSIGVFEDSVAIFGKFWKL